MQICYIFNWTEDIEKTLHTLEDIYQQIFLAKFPENLTLPRKSNSIFEPADSLPLKLNQLHLVRSDFHETLLGVSDGEYLQVCISLEIFSIPTVKVKT